MHASSANVRYNKIDICDFWKTGEKSKGQNAWTCWNSRRYGFYCKQPPSVIPKLNPQVNNYDMQPWGWTKVSVHGPNLYPKWVTAFEDAKELDFWSTQDQVYEDPTLEISQDWLSWFDMIKFGMISI